MKTLSACLYCAKKTECPDSIKSHSFTDSCFMTEDENIRAALEDLRALSLYPSVETLEKVNGVAETLLEQSEKMKRLAHYIAEENCEKYCANSNVFCLLTNPCSRCRKPCGCRDCKDMSNFMLDWSVINEVKGNNKID